jgi:hypothetical protein
LALWGIVLALRGNGLSLWINVLSLWGDVLPLLLIRDVFNLEIGMSFLIYLSRGHQSPKVEGDIV